VRWRDGAIHAMVKNLKLPQAVDGALKLLKAHVPYWGSDHGLSIAYHVLTGGARLEERTGERGWDAEISFLGGRAFKARRIARGGRWPSEADAFWAFANSIFYREAEEFSK